jgi:protein-tyrosine-phosphatase
VAISLLICAYHTLKTLYCIYEGIQSIYKGGGRVFLRAELCPTNGALLIMKTVLFVCVENSFRSQVAEAYFSKYAPNGWIATSAGVTPADRVNPNAVLLMQEEGIDISHKKPKILTPQLQLNSDIAIIVCSGSLCPVVYAKRVEDWGIPDPAPMLLDDARKVRDTIKQKVLELIQTLPKL